MSTTTLALLVPAIAVVLAVIFLAVVKGHRNGAGAAVVPPGLTADGPLDVGCKLSGTRGYTSWQATFTLYNPGDNPQTVSQVVVNWGSGGVLMSQQPYTGNWTIAPHAVLQTGTLAPGSATSCDIAGWNP